MFVEANRAIPWTKPEDIEIDPSPTKAFPKLGFGRPSHEFAVAFADGSIGRVLESLNPKFLRAFSTFAGGESIPDDVRYSMIIGKKGPER